MILPPAWEKAARLVGFSQYAPVDGRPAEQDTEVLVWYSPSAIHFGIRAQAAPDSVRASLANRDHIDADDAYAVDVQAAVSRTSDGGAARTAPLWQAVVNRNGRHLGFRYALSGIDEDFHAASGFISRGGIARANLDHRMTFFGPARGRWESLSCDVVLDGIWHYRDFARGPLLERKLHFNNNLALRGGWRAGRRC